MVGMVSRQEEWSMVVGVSEKNECGVSGGDADIRNFRQKQCLALTDYGIEEIWHQNYHV